MTSLPVHTDKPSKLIMGLLFLFGLLFSALGGLFLLAFLGYGFAETNTLLGITAKTPWYFTRAAGTVAYLLMAGSTIWGLLLSSKLIKESVPAALALVMHNLLSWLAIVLAGLHAIALLFDNYYTYSLADLTIPFIGPYRPVWVGLGIIGLYIMLATSLSFNFRKQIGQKRWRQLHYLTFIAFVVVTVHGILAGTDSGNGGLRLVYWGSGLLVLFLTNYRLVTAHKPKFRAQS